MNHLLVAAVLFALFVLVLVLNHVRHIRAMQVEQSYLNRRFNRLEECVSTIEDRMREDRERRLVEVIVLCTINGRPQMLGQVAEIGRKDDHTFTFGPVYNVIESGAVVICFGGHLSDVFAGTRSHAIFGNDNSTRVCYVHERLEVGCLLSVLVRREN